MFLGVHAEERSPSMFLSAATPRTSARIGDVANVVTSAMRTNMANSVGLTTPKSVEFEANEED